MATKLKIFVKNSLTQTVVQIILSILVLVVGLSMAFITNYEGMYQSGSIYGTADFSYQFQRRVHNIIEKEFVLKSPENIERIAKEKEVESKDVESIVITDAEDLDENRDWRSEDHYSYEHMISRWYQIDSNISDSPSFGYFIIDKDTGKQYSNLIGLKDKDSLSNHTFQLKIDANKIEATEIRDGKIVYLDRYTDSSVLKEASRIGNWEGVFVLQVTDDPKDVFKILMNKYDAIVPFFENLSQIYAGMIGVIVIGIFLFIYLLIVSIINGKAKKRYSDYIPNDLKCAIIFVSFPVMLIDIMGEFSFEPFAMAIYQSEQWLEITIIAALFLWILVGLQLTLSLVREASAGRFFKNTIIFGSIRLGLGVCTKCLKRLSRSEVFRRRTLIYLWGYGLVNFILGMLFLMDNELLSLFFGMLFNGVCLYLGYKNLQSLQKIMRYVSEGDVSERLDAEQISPLFYSFANQINGLQQNLEIAIKEAIKGERLKTELITNVSHDLKTPLTAIINYTALLKNKEVEDEETTKYIEVIDEKASVLKRLIDDVLEISKVSSGNVEINMETLDINQLIQQVLGEFEEALEQLNLNIITTELSTPLYVEADSLKLWRVVQNLISNITKYALPASRVFILAKNVNKQVVVEFKNISKDMLLTGNSELMERFVRGDVSRTMDGFGLGLAIAGDLMKLQKGHLDILVDGDLFKVILTLNVCEN